MEFQGQEFCCQLYQCYSLRPSSSRDVLWRVGDVS